jgi:preprotein translocase subunit SecG
VVGARGARTALSRATAVFAAIFMMNSLALAYMGREAAAEPKSILDEAATSAPLPQPQKPLPAAPAAPAAPATGTH